MNISNLHEFKVVFVGDAAVGKTSIIIRYHQNVFNNDQESTIGTAFISKTIETKNGPITLNIWDTAGQERFRSLVSMYSRGSSILFLVFDISQKDTFLQLDEWITKLENEISSDSRIIIVGNKCDLEFALPKDDIVEWCESQNLPLIFVSAKDGTNINELFEMAGNMISLEKSPEDPIQDLSVTSETHSCC